MAVLGANGASKTTTLLEVAGELKPLGGEVLLKGDNRSTNSSKSPTASSFIAPPQKPARRKKPAAGREQR